MKQVIKRTRKNARELFTVNGKLIPARFKYKVGNKFFPYTKEAYEFANNN